LLKAWLNPRWRILIFVVLANLAWMWPTWAWCSRTSWLWITPLALSINFLLLTYDQVLKFQPFQGLLLSGSDPWGLLKIVNDLSAKFQLAEPRVIVIPHASAQAFTYGKTRKGERIYVTEGALKLLSRDELEAVLTFQMLARKNSLSRLNYWLAAFVDLYYRAGKFLERGFSVVFGWTPPVAATLVSPWLFLLQSALISRVDFRRLDRETAEALSDTRAFASALWKLEAYAQTRPWDEPWTVSHMCIVSPLKMKKFLSPLRIQPALKERIKNLTGDYTL
jgi:heat shock protein HtpX